MKLTPEEIMKITPTYENSEFKYLDDSQIGMFKSFAESDYTPEDLTQRYYKMPLAYEDVTPLEWFRTISKNIKIELYNRKFKEKLEE